MFNFICKQCSRKCLSVGKPRCFHCIGQTNPGNLVDENLFQHQRNDVTSRDTDVVGGSGNNPTSNPSLKYKEKIQLNDPITMESGEVYRKSTQALSYEREVDFSPFSKEGGTTRDRAPEKITTEIQLSHDSFPTENKNREIFPFNRSTTLDSSIPQITSSYHQPMYSEKVSSGSCVEYNMKTTQNNPRFKVCTANITFEHGEEILSDAKGCNNVIKSDATSLFSYNSSLTDKKHKLSSAISNTEKHKEMNSDDFAAVAGPSGLQDSQQIRTSHRQMPLSNYVSEIPSVRVRVQYPLICKVCKMEIEEHLVKECNEYRCCVCKFTTSKHVNLQMHSYTHCREKTCNLCGKEYREGNLHDSEHTCSFCENVFHCRTQYEEHLLLDDHDQYLRSHCWACSKRNSNHWIFKHKEKIFACCFCMYDGDKVRNFYHHIRHHHLKFYCRICREEYFKSEESFHDRSSLCPFCFKSYRCQTQLEEHIGRGHKYRHEHPDLRLFKCEACGKRFFKQNLFGNHSGKCKHYNCEICGATFPAFEVLSTHRSEIYTQI